MESKPKKSTTPEAEKFPRQSVEVFINPGDGEKEIARKTSASTTSTEMAALRVMRGAERQSGYWESIDVPSLIEQLRDQAAAVNRGDLSQAEAMLMNQATALQSLFSRLVERAMGNENIAPFDANMRMALRAQSQCRATLETLATIKNPPIIYARQANVTTGPQQINNGASANPRGCARTREIETAQSQLSGATHELRSDTGASSIESGVNSALEAVGEIDRANVHRG